MREAERIKERRLRRGKGGSGPKGRRRERKEGGKQRATKTERRHIARGKREDQNREKGQGTKQGQ